VFPAGNQILISQVRNARTEPFTGEPANKYAINVLRLQHTQAAVQKQMASLIVRARGTMQVSKDYLPPKAAPTVAKAPVKNGS
jgi:hypothetical protein